MQSQITYDTHWKSLYKKMKLIFNDCSWRGGQDANYSLVSPLDAY